MIIENARYKFVNISSFDSVEFGSNREQGTTYLKVFFIDGLGKDNLVYVYIDKLLTKEEKFKIAKSLANAPNKFDKQPRASYAGFIFLFIIASHENFLKRNIHIFIFIHCCMNHTIIKVLTDDRTIWANHLRYLFDR